MRGMKRCRVTGLEEVKKVKKMKMCRLRGLEDVKMTKEG